MNRDDVRVLGAGVAIAAIAMIVTHPVAVAGALAAALWFARRCGALRSTPGLLRLAVGIGASVAVLNGAFSWNGATELWRAPFRVALLGRPIITLEAIVWGVVAGAQLAATTLALAAATLTAAPESLHRAMLRSGLPTSLATAAGMGLRMVPDTRRDAEAMRRALRTRGVETSGVRGTARVLVPLTARALDRAHVAEEALMMRGYDRAAMRRRGRSRPSWPVVATIVAVAAGAVVAVLAGGRPPYYPTIGVAWDAVTLAASATVLVPLVLLVRGVRPRSN